MVVEVVVVMVLFEEVELVVVVEVSSKQPHHPGVLQVDVLVLVFVMVGFVDELVVVIELLLSKYFQL